MSKLQKLSIREESLLHIDNTYTASFQGNAFSATSMPELLTRLRPAVENAAKAASVGFGMATKPNNGQQEAKQLLEAIDSQMIVGVVGRSDGKIENAMNVAGERAKGYVLKRMLDLGSSPYLNNYRWKKDDGVKVSDSKVGKGR